MVFSRNVSRIACALVAWITGFGYCLVLAVVPVAQCNGPSSNPFFAALAFAIPLVPLLLLSTLALEFRTSLRWLSVPFVLLVPLALRGVLPYLEDANVAAIRACSAAQDAAGVQTIPSWPPYWAPLQLAVLALLSVQVLRFWTVRRAG